MRPAKSARFFFFRDRTSSWRARCTTSFFVRAPVNASASSTSASSSTMLSFMVLYIFALTLAACRPAPQPHLEGTWRAVLSSPGGELPFTLRIARRAGGLRAVVVNGVEQVPVSGVSVDGSAVTIRFDWYDSAIGARLS